ncbi:multidrug ABC transporter permease [Bifidobacterium sp. UTCIF-39]|uniref:ABC transporter permease n=1 Tax=Bifidobacterium sp. UTCIF-39 TaxID=1465359 RepID=UPI00112A798F|nr:ABC transporter permease [Bifidobacterium sp. UTCIF-39]TPF97043.1 multidrug ABC transporter permease [Bifidobacterium sp. UTCIF-39]
MWTTFLITLKTNLRQRAALFWMFVFPIVLATMFNGMFGNLADAYRITAVTVAVVEDENWDKADGAAQFVDALAGRSNNVADLDTRLIETTPVPSLAEAKRLITDDTTIGYLTVNADGMLSLTLSTDTVETAKDASGNTSVSPVTIAALHNAIALYNRTDAVTRRTIIDHPQAVVSQRFWESVGSVSAMTKETSLTNFKPNATARYYYALLGMVCLMAMSYAISAVTMAQANLSALGIRRTVAPLSRAAQLAAGFLASWLCSFLSLIVALAYIRYVCGIALGGREPAAVLAVAVASFMSCAFGTMIGAIPGLTHATKIGLTSAIPCTLSLFTGLYGQFAMNLSDWITRNAPALAIINPAQQVTNLFYDILYYDSYRPFGTTCGILLAMSAVFLAVGVVMLRRQRYEHL